MSLGALALFLAVGTAAFADEPKVEVQAEVVLVSNKGTEIQPPELEAMKKKFAEQGLSFTSYKRMSTQKLALDKAKPAQVSLPNNKSAQLTLDGLQDGTAKLTVHVPPLEKVQYTLGREGSLYVDVGSYAGGKLVLVLSPPASSK